MYIHERKEWPKFTWDRDKISKALIAMRLEQGRLFGRMEELGFRLQQEAVLKTLTEDVIRSSEIEGEHLDTDQVRSSIARRLGMDIGGLKSADRNVEGIVEMMLDATRNYQQPLSSKRFFDWHSALFPTGRSGMRQIRVGAWRDDHDGPMQVLSGPVGRERIHFEAPVAPKLESEMKSFIEWFNNDANMDLVLKAGLAHIWFVTLHPFDDGNGRIARAISDMTLARSENSSQRFYSLSAQIQKERSAYYDTLESSQKGTLDVTAWLEWFLGCLNRAILGTQDNLAIILNKARFWKAIAPVSINERQRAILNRLLDGFEGKLTTSKWAKLTKCSQDTAHRDIQELLEHGVLIKNPEGGRSTSYRLTEIPKHND